MALTNEQKAEVDAELRRNGGKAGRAAADLDLPYEAVLNHVVDVNRKAIGVPYSADRPELRKYIIASKDIDAIWPRSGEIERAHYEYDKGYVELCQWREGNVIHLLSIRRRKWDLKRRGYFSRSFEEPCSRGPR